MEPELPVAQSTIFSWAIAGELNFRNPNHFNVNLHAEIDIDQSIRKFWELEEVVCKSPYSHEENLCEKHFKENYSRHTNGRFIVRLPFKDTDMELGESKSKAFVRFQALERKFKKDCDLKLKYSVFMKEYEQLEHMKLIPENKI